MNTRQSHNYTCKYAYKIQYTVVLVFTTIVIKEHTYECRYMYNIHVPTFIYAD